MRPAVALALLLLGPACGRPPPPEPAAPEPVATTDGTIDAAVEEAPPAIEDIVDVEPPPGPLQVGDPMPPLPPPPCGDAAARREEIDVNGDGTPEVRKVFLRAGGAEWLACKLTDVDIDGDFDIAALYDRGGDRLADYLDLDFDGTVDMATWYEPGSGKPAATAHDLDDDGVVDNVDVPGGPPP